MQAFFDQLRSGKMLDAALEDHDKDWFQGRVYEWGRSNIILRADPEKRKFSREYEEYFGSGQREGDFRQSRRQ
jgi:hypothetical protein